jgi:hypothetical protein
MYIEQSFIKKAKALSLSLSLGVLPVGAINS